MYSMLSATRRSKIFSPGSYSRQFYSNNMQLIAVKKFLPASNPYIKIMDL